MIFTKLSAILFIHCFAFTFQDEDSSLKDDTVFEEIPNYDEPNLQVGMQTKKDLPAGHMKQLGEHDKPIIGKIAEIDYMISGKDFYEKFARKRKPVIFRGVTRNWAATKHWKNETYLLEKYADVLFDVEMGKVYDAALNTRKTMDMREFLALYKKKTLYLDSPFPQTPMMADMELPLMLQCEGKYKSFQSMHLLFSNGSTSSPLHHDGYENFLSSFSGIKVVYIMEPKYGKELYVQFVEDFPGLSPINPQAVDFTKYPLFASVPFHKITIHPGDMLYIPQYWYHQVRSFQSPNIAASMWFQMFPIPDVEQIGFREILSIADKFAVGVNSSPETIECPHQNRPMQDVDRTVDLKAFSDLEVEKKEEEMNLVTLNEEVLPGQPTIYAGSDDTYIYAVDMLNGRLKWKIKTRRDTGSTCHFNSDDTLVYCGADDGFMRAMYTNNGSVLWQFQTGGPIISSVRLDDEGNLYFGCLDYYMYSLTNIGEQRWKRFLGNVIWSTPLLVPKVDMLVVGTKVGENDTRSNIFALEMTSGKFIWRMKAEGGIVASPRLNQVDLSVCVCSTKGILYKLDLLEGTIVWREDLNTTGTEELSSTPALDQDGTVYVLTGSAKLVAMDTTNRLIKWSLALRQHKGERFDGKEDDRGSNSSPLLGYDGTLYVGAGFGVVYAIDPIHGEIKWQTRIGSGIFFSSPRLSKQHALYIGSLDGSLVALDAKTGKELWRLVTNGPFVGTALITRGFA